MLLDFVVTCRLLDNIKLTRANILDIQRRRGGLIMCNVHVFGRFFF